jgi:glycosyltransferase involved in cell wall biosynthesis
MNIIHTLPSVESKNAGPSYSVPRLCQTLALLGHDVRLLTLGSPDIQKEDRFIHERLSPDLPPNSFLGRLGRSQAMAHAINKYEPDILHAHGLWMMPSVYPSEVARRLKKPFLLAPRGMLGPAALEFSRFKKQIFLQIWQKQSLEAVSCFHATATSEHEDIRKYGLEQPVAVIPNGIDLPELPLLLSGASQKLNKPYVLSLGRIHPKKALPELVAAWRLMRTFASGWQLRIVGPDEVGHAAELQKLVHLAGLENEISIEGPVNGDAKIDLMRQAEIFVLSTLHENFAMTVAESLAVGTPVISTKGAPWAGLKEHKCGWWVEHGAASIAAALTEAIALPREKRREMGEHGRAWMQRDFAWSGIGHKMFDVYNWLLQGGTRPSCVQID